MTKQTITTDDADFLQSIGIAPGKHLDAPPVALVDIEFDPEWVAQFRLDKTDMADASRVIFQRFKGPRGSQFNKDLHAQITTWLTEEKKRRGKPDDKPVKAKVKAGKKQRDLLARLAEVGITSAEDLERLMEGQ